MNWVVRYTLACGHSSGRVTTTDKHKKQPGDVWPCAVCGTDQEIVAEGGHGA